MVLNRRQRIGAIALSVVTLAIILNVAFDIAWAGLIWVVIFIVPVVEFSLFLLFDRPAKKNSGEDE